MEKRERENNIIFAIILRLLGRKSSRTEGKRTEMLGKKFKIIGAGKNIKLQGNLYTPV